MLVLNTFLDKSFIHPEMMVSVQPGKPEKIQKIKMRPWKHKKTG